MRLITGSCTRAYYALCTSANTALVGPVRPRKTSPAFHCTFSAVHVTTPGLAWLRLP